MMTDINKIEFVDLKAQYYSQKGTIDCAIQKVLDHGRFIMGPEVGELEAALSVFTGAKHAIGCSSGTDALLLIMMAENIGPGDAVFVPSFTFTATAEVPLLLGATPVFVDVNPNDFNICTIDLEKKINSVKAEGVLTPRGILATDIFGLPANYDSIHAIATSYQMIVWGDCAQSFGASMGGKQVGSLCRASATSFFPAKPFGCYGDGGAVFTDDDDLAEAMTSIRAHGKGGEKYDIVRVGINARLDTIQAAILLAKLPLFQNEIQRRNAVADIYDSRLRDHVKIPRRFKGRSSVWAQYTIKLPPRIRDKMFVELNKEGIPTAIYYPKPMHLQTAYAGFGKGQGSLPNSEELSQQVLSLPIHPYLTDSEVNRVSDSILDKLNVL